MSLGEGSAVLVLEREADARRRAKPILGYIHGAGASCDAHHMTAPQKNGEGPSLAIRAALLDAGVQPSEIDFVNAHGTGTRLNDRAEANALHLVFGAAAKTLPLTSTKGSIGHLLGCAGAVEAIATLLCLRHGEVHPTPGREGADPELAVHLVHADPLPLPQARNALSTSLAFGGSNAALVLGAEEVVV
jgi:3-oxoacyl-[acyl-carrier-protein] synthase II